MVKELLRVRITTGRVGFRLIAQRIHINGVMPREGGASSTPQLLDSITASSEYWIARSSRAMTARV
jgi:hypothetical protein